MVHFLGQIEIPKLIFIYFEMLKFFESFPDNLTYLELFAYHTNIMTDNIETVVRNSQLLVNVGMTYERLNCFMCTVAEDNTSVKLYLFPAALSYWRSPSFDDDMISLDDYLKTYNINAWITHNNGREEEEGMILWLSRKGVYPDTYNATE